uniref:Protein kinase domain-containing protein n=1 Tax=Oryza glumipatula TaxID=40148 RepID=A0A0D9ZYG8_9ORYZ
MALLLLWVLGCSLLSSWILSSMSSHAVDQRRAALAGMCDERARMLQEQVKASMTNHFQAQAILVSKNASAIDQMAFARYVAESTAFDSTHAERELFERQRVWSIAMKRPSPSKMMMNSSSSSKRSPPDEYVRPRRHALGGSLDSENVLRAIESGKVVLTAPLRLLSNRIGVISAYAVYKSELPLNATVQDRIQSSIGYLTGVFDIEEHVDKLLQKLAGKEQPIMVNVYDTTTSEIPISMHRPKDKGSGMCHVSTINFGDPSRKHEMHCRFVKSPPWPWMAIALSYGTLVVSLLVGYMFHSTDKRIAKATDMQMPVKDGSAATERIAEVERDLNERVGRGENPPECASARQWPAPILSMTADVSQPFEGEQLYRQDARFLHKQELNLAENLDQEEEQELNLRSEALEGLGTSSKFITKVKKLTSASIHCLRSQFHYLNKKVASIGLLGLLLYILVIGAFDQLYNQRLGMRKGGDNNMMLNNFGWSHGRLLISTLHGTWAKRGVQRSDMIRVDLRKITGNNDSSWQQKHWSPHNSNEKALANWISNGTTYQSSKYQEETTGIQNGTVKPHLPVHKSHRSTVGPWIASVPVIIMLVILGTLLRVQQKELELLGRVLGPSRFELHELAAATSNFAQENKLGQGGFGPVYKGYLRDHDLHVAIKVFSRRQSSQEQSEQGLREFKAEVKVMTQLRHRNVVKLVGWCDSKKRLLLVYELMAQGSLDKHLYDPEKTLTWQRRYKIALDLGSALLYLHRDCEKCIVHGDIKPANVMLDVSDNAKLGDFGLARLVEHGGEPQTTQVVAGTPGYIDPEFINNRWPRTESDVYSFGVVLLEIACCKRPASRQLLPNGASSLLSWVHGLYDLGKILDAADQRLNGEFDQQQMERVIVTGLWCAHQDPMQRPSIVQAMDVLRSADAELPARPAAVHDARHIRSIEEQAYADLPVEGGSVHAVTPSAYFTSKDSAYLLAEEGRILFRLNSKIMFTHPSIWIVLLTS